MNTESIKISIAMLSNTKSYYCFTSSQQRLRFVLILCINIRKGLKPKDNLQKKSESDSVFTTIFLLNKEMVECNQYSDVNNEKKHFNSCCSTFDAQLLSC